jgi:hypothetical protein
MMRAECALRPFDGARAMPSPDWRSEAAYADLEAANLRDFAWEYLRRNPAYARDWRAAAAAAAASGETDDVAMQRWSLRFLEGSEPSGDGRADLLGTGGLHRHRRALGLAAAVLASLAGCATGCEFAAARD